MKYYFDTEFIEDGKTIDLISIGIVAADGREYYAVNCECDYSKASDWVLENVLTPMGLDRDGFKTINKRMEIAQDQGENDLLERMIYTVSHGSNKNRETIKEEVVRFVLNCENENLSYEDLLAMSTNENPDHIFYAYYADYDWVVFCQLFGTMMDLPKGFPMYCRDIKQLCDELGNPKLPEQGKGEHNALEDARWNRKTYLWLRDYQINRT